MPEVAQLLAARGLLTVPDQLVHGDLAGNVLFGEGLAPAGHRLLALLAPEGFASAVVAADAVLWYDADIDGRELLIRALLFRLLAHDDPAAHAHVYRPAIEYVDRPARPDQPSAARYPTFGASELPRPTFRSHERRRIELPLTADRDGDVPPAGRSPQTAPAWPPNVGSPVGVLLPLPSLQRARAD